MDEGDADRRGGREERRGLTLVALDEFEDVVHVLVDSRVAGQPCRSVMSQEDTQRTSLYLYISNRPSVRSGHMPAGNRASDVRLSGNVKQHVIVGLDRVHLGVPAEYENHLV